MIYSQGQEQTVIEKHFSDIEMTHGHLLSIGENDGKTFSNSLALIEKGWYATLFEPNPFAFEKLYELHKKNARVVLHKKAIANYDGTMILHCNAPHIKCDIGLLSTLVPSEKNRWGELPFSEEIVNVNRLCSVDLPNNIHFITIDAEGMDYDILTQIDLKRLDTRMVCIEWNSIETEAKRMTEYCNQHGLNEIYRNAENLIFAK